MSNLIESKLMSWPTVDGNVVLSHTPNGIIADVQEKGKTHRVSQEWIFGLPKATPTQLKAYLQHTTIKISRNDNIVLRINQTLRGGGLPALGGFFSSVSSLMSFFTSANYIKLVHAAGSEARATIHVAGTETRATIEKAEDSAKTVLTKMGSEVRTSIDRAQKSAQEVIRTAGSEMNNTLSIAGIEARYTSKIMQLQVEKTIDKAARETQLLLETAGMESKHAILLYGDEARKTCLSLSHEVTNNIKTISHETDQILTKGSQEVRAILDKASTDAKAIIQHAGTEYNQVIHQALTRAQIVIDSTLEQAHERTAHLITLLSKEAQGIILNLGSLGQLLIKDTSQEIRLIADEVLSKAFAGQEMIISLAGEEARLTIAAAGHELRSTLYELPSIAGLLGEQLGRNFVFGLKDGLLGTSHKDDLINKLKNLKGSAPDIQNLLKFVYDQKLPPPQKTTLYLTLISLFNTPSIPDRDRQTLLLLTGVAALNDAGLIALPGFIFYGFDHRHSVISAIPTGTASELLEAEGAAAINHLLPKPIPLTPPTPPNPLELLTDRQKLQIHALENALAATRHENALLLTLSESTNAKATQTQDKLALKTLEATTLSQQVATLFKRISQQQRELAFHLPPPETENC